MSFNNNGSVPEQMELTERSSPIEDNQLGVTNSETSFVNQPPLYSRPIADSDSIARTSLGYGDDSTLICDDSIKSFSTLDSELASNYKGPVINCPSADVEISQKSDSDISRYFHSNAVALNGNTVASSNGRFVGNYYIAPLASGESSIASSSASEKTSSTSGFRSAAGPSSHFACEFSFSDVTPPEETYTTAENLDSSMAWKFNLIDRSSLGNNATDADSINQELNPTLGAIAASTSNHGDSMIGIIITQTNVPSVSPIISATTHEETLSQNDNGTSSPTGQPISFESRNGKGLSSNWKFTLFFAVLVVIILVLSDAVGVKSEREYREHSSSSVQSSMSHHSATTRRV